VAPSPPEPPCALAPPADVAELLVVVSAALELLDEAAIGRGHAAWKVAVSLLHTEWPLRATMALQLSR
jgi:hypothetical protein